MKPTSHTSLFIFVIIVAAAGAYWYSFVGGSEEAALSAYTPMSQAHAQFQALISQLSPISFPTDIFSDPRFGTLVDLTTPVSPEPAGRSDPFAEFR